jgi:hypothetical protein
VYCPYAQLHSSQAPNTPNTHPPEGLSSCVTRGLANRPQKGDLIMFYALRPDGAEDEASLHESCPTLKGVRGRVC